MCLHSALLLTFLAVATGKPIAQSLFVEDSTNSFTSDYKPVGISHTKKDALIAEIIFPSISEPDCSSTALTDQIIDGTYQEQNLWRRQACSTSPKTPKKRTKKQDATPSTGLAQQQLEMNQPATETVVNPCAGQAQDRYVTCGGPEILKKDTNLILNCVPEFAKTIEERVRFWATTAVAEFCCGVFLNQEPFYFSSNCKMISDSSVLTQWPEERFKIWSRSSKKFP